MDWNYDTPEKPGHYLVLWDTITSREYPTICSRYDVLYWMDEWYAPVNDKQPVLVWAELPAAPEGLV